MLQKSKAMDQLAVDDPLVRAAGKPLAPRAPWRSA
jgi:hypothetical protein